jgi:hypothetical protein
MSILNAYPCLIVGANDDKDSNKTQNARSEDRKDKSQTVQREIHTHAKG